MVFIFYYLECELLFTATNWFVALFSFSSANFPKLGTYCIYKPMKIRLHGSYQLESGFYRQIAVFFAAPHLNLEPKRIYSDNKSILSSTSRERQIESESDERDRAPRLSVRLLNRITTKAKIRQCIRACRHTEHTRDIVNAVHKVKRPWQGWKCLLTTERREEGKISKANNNTGKAAEKWDRIWVTVATFLSVVSFLSVSFLFGLWLHMLCSYSMADFEQRQ